jgi:HlyD family secretion protein
MKRVLLILGSIVAVIAFGAVSYRTWSGAWPGVGSPAGAATPANEPLARVVTAPAIRKTLRRTTEQPGQIQAFEQTPIFVKFPGYVRAYHKDIGDRVEQSQLLAELGIPELEDEVHQKEAMESYAKAGVQQATIAVQAAELAVETAQAKVREARAGTIRALGKYERWKSEHARAVQLEASQSIDQRLVDETQNELSAAEAARREADAMVGSAEAVLAERKVGVKKSKADLAVAQTNVVHSQADLARTKSLLSYTQIRMPYTGTVVERNINRGDFVQPANMATAKPLYVVARSDTVRVFVDVPELEAGKIVTGAKGLIHVQAIPDRAIEGTVARTSWALGANRTLRTELDILNPQGLLRPGMYAMAEIVLEEHPSALALPPAAVFTVNKQAYCCCVHDGTVVRRSITVGLRTTQDVEVLKGLQPNELVVQSQPAALREGQRVEAVRP